MKNEYFKPSIGFTAFKNSTKITGTLNVSDPTGIESPKMDDLSYKVNKLPKS